METCVIITTSDILKTLYVKRYTKQQIVHSTMYQSKVRQNKQKKKRERETERERESRLVVSTKILIFLLYSNVHTLPVLFKVIAAVVVLLLPSFFLVMNMAGNIWQDFKHRKTTNNLSNI